MRQRTIDATAIGVASPAGAESVAEGGTTASGATASGTAAHAVDRWLVPRVPTFAEADRAILMRHWYPVARVEDVAASPLAVMLLDLELVVYRVGGELRVARDLCPHRGVPLHKGRIDGDALVCAYHGLRFGADGACTGIPAHPGTKPASRLKLRLFPAVERYGLAWTSLDPQPGEGPPDFPAWEEPGFQRVSPPYVDIASSAGRQIEGFVDVVHFAWIHDQSFAERSRPEVGPYEVEKTAQGIRYEYASTVSNYPRALQHLAPADFMWRRVFEIYPPFTAVLTVHFPNGMHHVLNAASPVSATRTRLFTPVARNFTDIGTTEQAAQFKIQIVIEDRDIVESQYPAELPLDWSIDAHIPADRMSLAYRALLRGMGLKLGSA